MGEIINFIDSNTPLPSFSSDKKVSLITGCFDLIHSGHIDLFRFAKKHSDIVIVGLDADEAIAKTKGNKRPILLQDERSKILSELLSIEYVIKLNHKEDFNSKEAAEFHDFFASRVSPTYIVTAAEADLYSNSKRKRAKKIGAKLLLDLSIRENSTSNIINKILDLNGASSPILY